MSIHTLKRRRPKFSVIIPAFNRAYVIEDAIQSVLRQNIDEVEIIVIDDGSTDNTRALLEGYHEKVIYVYQENQGISGARNKGLSLASGEYISFLDSDDIFVPGKMERELELFTRFSDAEVIAADASLFKDGVDLNLSYMVKRNFKFADSGGYILDANETLWIQGSMFPVCSMVLRRSVLEKLGLPLYDTSYPSAEDWDLEIRLINQCKILIDSAVTSHVRRFDDGTREIRDLGVKDFHRSVLGIILKKRILEKALKLENWPVRTIAGIKKKIEECESYISHHFMNSSSSITNA